MERRREEGEKWVGGWREEGRDKEPGGWDAEWGREGRMVDG